MSCFVVTRDNRLLRYDEPSGKSGWLKDVGNRYSFFYKSCTCRTCTDDTHEQLIAYIDKSSIVAIGFDRPAAIEGRLITYSEKACLRDVANWISTSKAVPKKIRRLAQPLLSLAKLIAVTP